QVDQISFRGQRRALRRECTCSGATGGDALQSQAVELAVRLVDIQAADPSAAGEAGHALRPVGEVGFGEWSEESLQGVGVRVPCPADLERLELHTLASDGRPAVEGGWMEQLAVLASGSPLVGSAQREDRLFPVIDHGMSSRTHASLSV